MKGLHWTLARLLFPEADYEIQEGENQVLRVKRLAEDSTAFYLDYRASWDDLEHLIDRYKLGVVYSPDMSKWSAYTTTTNEHLTYVSESHCQRKIAVIKCLIRIKQRELRQETLGELTRMSQGMGEYD